MKKYIVAVGIMLSLLHCNQIFARIQPLKVSDNGRYLVKQNGDPIFLHADTAWGLTYSLKKNDVNFYLDKRKKQKFNALGTMAFADEMLKANAYGELPFEVKNGKYDPLKPIVNPNKYDYWDHLNYIINAAAKRDMYVILLPAWGNYTAGDYGTGKPIPSTIINEKNAYQYAKWIGNRFKKHKNIIWMLGGDRSAANGKYDYRNVFNLMAKGLIDGTENKNILISYHPRKWQPNSSEWFHNAPWLSFNSVQDQPSDQINAISHDWNLNPPKPTWLFEGGYELRGQSPDKYEIKTKQKNIYTDWQVRFQAYQTIFAGGFGETYGDMPVRRFSKTWKKHLDDPGANQLAYLVDLMSLLSKKQYLERVPDQSLLRGDTGKMTKSEGMYSTCLVATRTKEKELAMVYTAGTKDIIVKMNLLKGPKMYSYWFSPRTGRWKIYGSETNKMIVYEKNIASGEKALDYEFHVPGHPEKKEDWILVLANKNYETAKIPPSKGD